MTKTTCSSHTYRADRECAINSSPPQSLIPVTQRPHEVNVLVMTGRSFIVGCVHSFCASVTASMAAVLAIPKKSLRERLQDVWRSWGGGWRELQLSITPISLCWGHLGVFYYGVTRKGQISVMFVLRGLFPSNPHPARSRSDVFSMHLQQEPGCAKCQQSIFRTIPGMNGSLGQ